MHQRIKKLKNLFSENLQVFEILDDARMTEEESLKRRERGEALLAAVKEEDVDAKEIDREKIKSFLEGFDVACIEVLVVELQKFLRGKIQEGISGPEERYKGQLESCLSPLIKLNYGEDPLLIVTEIYYRLIKNHPFFDGNKKIAVAILLEIMEQQGIKLDAEEISDITLTVAASNPKEFTQIIDRVKKYLERQK